MIRIDSIEDEMKGYVTYDLLDGRRVRLDAMAVREYGAGNIMREMGLGDAIPKERVPVIHHGRRVGTLPPDFDPGNIYSRSFMYDPRPGDFTRDGGAWIAHKNLGGGDLDMIRGFERDHSVREPT